MSSATPTSAAASAKAMANRPTLASSAGIDCIIAAPQAAAAAAKRAQNAAIQQLAVGRSLRWEGSKPQQQGLSMQDRKDAIIARSVARTPHTRTTLIKLHADASAATSTCKPLHT